MKILIGYDGSDCAERALYDLRRAGLPREAEAIVLSVADVWLMPPDGGPDDSSAKPDKAREKALGALEQARSLAEKASKTVLELFPSWAVRPEACADTPAWGLVLKAAEWKPDLVVVGSNGRSAIGRLVLGSVSQKAVTHADCSVRVARGRIEERDSPIRLVVGVDGSPCSEAAVEAIAKREWPAGTEARVVTALDLMMMTALNWIDSLNDEDEAEVTAFVEAAAEKLRAAGLVATTVVKNGDPKRVLVDEAEAWEADSIFVGAQGLRAVERLLIGSVSAGVAAHARCSVEVVRTAQTA